MGNFQLDRAWAALTGLNWVVIALWAGLAVFTLTFIVLLFTRWGQSKPLQKCVVLSLLAHLLLVGYATTVKLVYAHPGSEDEEPEQIIRVSFDDGFAPDPAVAEPAALDERPWERLLHEQVSLPEPDDPQRPEPEPPSDLQRPESERPGDLPNAPLLSDLAMNDVERPDPEPAKIEEPPPPLTPGKTEPEAIDTEPPKHRQPPPLPLPEPPAPELPPLPAEPFAPPIRPPGSEADVDNALTQPALPPLPMADIGSMREPDDPWAQRNDADASPLSAFPVHIPRFVGEGSTISVRPSGDATPGTPASPPAENPAPSEPPEIYKLRTAPDRTRVAMQQGATPESEAAVEAALKWLAENQRPDGSWDASQHGSGKEQKIGQRDRQGAGLEADTGVSALALLAFLAAGNTHLEGEYRENVQFGLQYLLRSQAADGNLAGRASQFAKMYCHSMATLALSEGYAMTKDDRLLPAVRRAVSYTIAAQDPDGGGWRYRAGEPGDTSQCGWQLMALKSADLAGISMPVRTRNGLIRYLRTVAAGEHGGLASYRPKEQITRPMTAEALVCWQFLGMPRDNPASNEAGDYLLAELPGQSRTNLYYWYYGTLGMYQLQGTHWERWNEALQKTLPASQQTTGPLAGSWDPDTVWGGYGGRVYSTALATLCLEVYYRFLPLYVKTAPGQ